MADLAHLRASTTVDLAAVDLDYESFRALAQNPHLSWHERIGFPDAYREGFESAILADILAKLPLLVQREGLTVVDIGPGCANLPRMLIDVCRQQKHRIVLVDSEEMLAQLPDVEGTTLKVAGCFPLNLQTLLDAAGAADVVLCYSVMHYLYVDSNPFDVMDATMTLLAPGGSALYGDIPNASKRRRFFASAAGKAFHRQFTGTNTDPEIHDNRPLKGKIDDAVLAGCIARAQAAGCDAYLLPQPCTLPMANRRDDLLIRKP
jgi:2-polyprenyl-3-methyl-5-hydroxy-6-metoxy-1,4-benzoquinol methylase